MKNDLSDLKVGDKVWHVRHGERSVSHINNGRYLVVMGFQFSLEGKGYMDDNHPTIFRSLDAMIDYWTEYRDSVNKISGRDAVKAFKEGLSVRRTKWENKQYYISTEAASIDDLFELLYSADSDKLEWELAK